MLEALLSYWLSWFVLLSWLEDGLNTYVFPVAILLVKGKAGPRTYLPRVPVRQVGRVCHKHCPLSWPLRCGNSYAHELLHMFLWEQFEALIRTDNRPGNLIWPSENYIN